MSQVDRTTGLVGNSAMKVPVRVATTANITLSGTQTIDGIAVVADDRVLVKNQTSSVDNGIYVVDTGTWSRAQDCDGVYDLVDGSIIFIVSGTTNGNQFYQCTASNPITIGSTALTWALIAGALITSPVSVSNGGTGNTTMTSGAYLKGAGASAITAQTVPIPIADGGTNATTAAAAFTNIVAPGGTMTGAINFNTTSGLNTSKTTVASAASPDIWTSTGNIIDYTGTTTATGFAAAPQAGATRILVCAGAAPFTAGANMLIQGVASGSTYTATAGDLIWVFAVTTTQFRSIIYRQDGAASNVSLLTNSLGSDVAINNASNYFDGPSVAQGTSGTWFASGSVTAYDTAAATNILVKLWDGTTVIASTQCSTDAANRARTIALSGYIASPAGNIKMSVKTSTTTGVISASVSGNSHDSTLSAIRIK